MSVGKLQENWDQFNPV